MAEALHLFIQHALTSLGLRRLEAHIALENTDSIRVAERHGFVTRGQRAPIQGRDAHSAGIVIYTLNAARGPAGWSSFGRCLPMIVLCLVSG